MKHLFTIRLAFMAVSLLGAGAAFTACEDDIEINNNTGNPWENVEGTFGAVRSAAGARQGTTLTVKNGQAATGHVYFELSKAAEQDLEVTFSADADALQAYNTANGTSYTACQGVTFSNGGKVTIAKGQRKSDYVEVNFSQGGAGQAAAITATASDGVTVSTNNASYVYQVTSVNIPQSTKAIKNLCYIEVNNENPLNAGEYTLSNGEPFFDIVSIFAANINLNSEGVPYVACNDQVKFVLEHADEIIRPLQEKGIKVHLSILGNHDDAGMRSLSEEGARAFAQDLKRYVDIYGFDGIDFDDEYSSYAGDGSSYTGSSPAVVGSVAECTPQNYTRFLEICREYLPKDETAFGIYWYTTVDHPLGSNVEDLIDYAVFGSYGSYYEYYGQNIGTMQAPYAINIANDYGIVVSETSMNNVTNGGFEYFACYNLRASRYYTPYFNKVAEYLYGQNSTIKWSGKTYARTEFDASLYTIPSYDSYVGQWTVTSPAIYYFVSDDGSSAYWQFGQDQTFNVSVVASGDGRTYKVYGWESNTEEIAEITEENPFEMEYDPLTGVAYAKTQSITKDGKSYLMALSGNSSWHWNVRTNGESMLVTHPGGTVQLMNGSSTRSFNIFNIDSNGDPVSWWNWDEDRISGAQTFKRQ